MVAIQIQRGSAWLRSAAEEALWRFPPAHAQGQLRELLSQRDFVLRHPEIAARLLERASATGTDGLARSLAALAPLRFYFWKPALARVGLKARKLAKR